MSDTPKYSLIDTGEQQFVTVFIPGYDPFVADNTHPNFDAIVELARDGETYDDAYDLIELFDVARTVAARLLLDDGPTSTLTSIDALAMSFSMYSAPFSGS